MRESDRVLAFLVAALVIIVLARFGAGGEWVVRLKDGRIISFARMIAEVEGKRLIFVGEDHDRPDHHRAELRIIRTLDHLGVPLAIGLEMFTAESQGVLDGWVAGTLDRESFIRCYYRDWGMPWPLYRDIFLYARKRRIPLVGLNVPRDVSRKVAEEGFAALTPAERARLPGGITCTVDPVYRAFIRKAFAEHSLEEDAFTHFCEAQMLWNKGMGWNLREYLGRHPERKVVVLTGVGHAMKRGIPAEVFGGKECVVILPEGAGVDRGTTTRDDADYLILFSPGWERVAAALPHPP